MMCYKDRAFCSSNCINTSCRRYLSEEVKEGARKWWHHDPDNAPIASMDFSPYCAMYQPPGA